MAEQLGLVGVSTTIQQLDAPSLAAVRIGDTTAPPVDLLIGELESHAHDGPDHLFFLFHSSAGGLADTFGNYSNPEFDALVEQTLAIPAESDERLELIHRAQDILAQDLPMIALYYPAGRIAYRPAAYDGWTSDEGHGIFTKRSLLAAYADIGGDAHVGPRPEVDPFLVPADDGVNWLAVGGIGVAPARRRCRRRARPPRPVPQDHRCRREATRTGEATCRLALSRSDPRAPLLQRRCVTAACCAPVARRSPPLRSCSWLAFGLWGAPPASAHTALLGASPGPDQTVGGVVEGIDLAFLDPITDAIVTVSYNGAPVPGSTTVANGELIRFEFDQPLQEVGRYQVFYEMTSFDSDYTTSGFFFTYDVNAAPLVPLDAPGANDDSSFPILPTAIAGIVLVALLAGFVWFSDSRRRQTAGVDGRREHADANRGYHGFDYGEAAPDNDYDEYRHDYRYDDYENGNEADYAEYHEGDGGR